MTRKTVYIPDEIDRKIEGIVLGKRQAGANAQEASFSSVTGELLRLGLMVYESQNEDRNVFDLQGYRQAILSEVVKTRSHVEIMSLMVSEMSQALLYEQRDPEKLTQLANECSERANEEIDLCIGQFFLSQQEGEE